MTSALTIITATYNAADTLAECICSVARQHVDVEHILIDGGSTDDTLQLAGNHRDVLATVISEPDQGVYDGMNKGVRLATGEVVGILNADDFYPSEDVLARVSEVFLDAQVDACFGDLMYVNSVDTAKVTRFWRSGEYDARKFYDGWMPPHPTFFVRREVYEKYGLFRLDMGSAADYELMLRFLLRHRINAVYIPQVLVHMRTNGVSNASLMNRLRANRNDRKAWKVNGLKPKPWTLVAKPLRKVGQWFV